MKKLFVAILAISCLLAAPAAKAQTINQTYPNEISFGYGVSLIGSATNMIINNLGLVSLTIFRKSCVSISGISAIKTNDKGKGKLKNGSHWNFYTN